MFKTFKDYKNVLNMREKKLLNGYTQSNLIFVKIGVSQNNKINLAVHPGCLYVLGHTWATTKV